MNGKRKILLVFLSLVAVLVIWSLAVADTEKPKNGNSKIRVGVFDSRAVACAQFGKFIEEGGLKKIYSEHAKDLLKNKV